MRGARSAPQNRGDHILSLSRKQTIFTSCIGQLIKYADNQGYGLTFGDAYRDPRVHGEFGKKHSYATANSVHKLRLAVDFNLFIGFDWIRDGKHEAWQDLGDYWETLDPDARWGGRFNDANHFSFEQWGSK